MDYEIIIGGIYEICEIKDFAFSNNYLLVYKNNVNNVIYGNPHINYRVTNIITLSNYNYYDPKLDENIKNYNGIIFAEEVSAI